jgi:hypothetical protein
MEAKRSSDTSFDFQLTARRYDPYDTTLENWINRLDGMPKPILQYSMNQKDACAMPTHK